jgi:putative ABC transport system substrate-binding protein
VLLALCTLADAQPQAKIPRVGYLAGGDSISAAPSVGAFRQGLRDLGYIDGKNILIDSRYAEGKPNRIARLIGELVQLKVDVIVAIFLSGIRAAKDATQTIPIVMVAAVDPVAAGLVASLARPGGNITGLTTLQRDLSGKRLQLLTELIPRLSQVAILWNVDGPGSRIAFKEYEVAARALKIQLQSLELATSNPDLEAAFEVANKAQVSALITIRNPVLRRYTNAIAQLATKNRLPSVHEGSESVEAGGLMSYGTNDAENYKRAAYYVDRILRGAKPAELPVERPTKFEFVINLKTAKQIGLAIPPNVLARADRVIR